MRRIDAALLFSLLLTVVCAPARAAEPAAPAAPEAAPPTTPTAPEAAPPAAPKATPSTSALLFEGGGGLNACSGEFCTKGGPSWGVDLTALYRMNRHFALGFNVHYGRMAPDQIDTLYDYVINFEARGILPLGSRLELFASAAFGYATTYADGVFDEEDGKYLIFRATGVTLGAVAGLSVRVAERLHVGLVGRFWAPNWSDACFYEADGGECTEPEDLEFEFEMMPWYAGLFVRYELPY